MRYAVVTGSTKGIGKSIAERLLEEGWFVFVNYAKDQVGANLFINQNIKYRESFQVILCELSSYENVQYFIDSILKRTDQIDSLILNAGATDRSSFHEITRDSWEYVINTNINAPFYLIHGLADKMVPKTGRIILIGSVCGIYPHAGSPAYGITKAASHQMAKELVKFFAPWEITVNAIAPGFVDTPRQGGKPLDQRKSIENKTALKRFGSSAEIASLCMEIINNQFINGAVLSIDGGYSCE